MRARNVLLAIAATALALGSSACATIADTSVEDVTFESEPKGATVEIDGEKRGKTPVTVTLDSQFTYEIVFRKTGYEIHKTTIAGKRDAGWLVLDILLFGFPVAVDYMTGDWYSFREHTVAVKLDKKEGGTEPERPPAEKRPDPSLSAKELFKRAAKHYKAEEYEAALVDFQAAYQRAPKPVLRYNIALTHSKLGHPRKVIATIEGMDDESKLSDKIRAKIQALETSNRLILKARSMKGKGPDS